MILKSDNLSLSYNRKCLGCFFSDAVYSSCLNRLCYGLTHLCLSIRLNLRYMSCRIVRIYMHVHRLQMKAYFETYQLFFKENLPQLFAHFSSLQVTPDIYIIDWLVLLTVLGIFAFLIGWCLEFLLIISCLC